MSREGFQERAAWLHDNIWEIINPVAVVVIGLVKLFFEELGDYWAWGILIVAVIFFIISVVKIIRNKKRASVQETAIEKLSDDIEDLELTILNYQKGYENLLSSYMSIIFSKLELTEDERISVYHHTGEHFSMICRYSTNPELKKKGRPAYPDGEGFIGKGFQLGSFAHAKLPNPDTDVERYVSDTCRVCAINEHTVRNLSMKSRSYIVEAIKHPITTDNVAVVVFESRRYDFNTVEPIKEVMDELGSQIVSYIHYSENIRPELAFAKERGL